MQTHTERLVMLLALDPSRGAVERRLGERDWNQQAACRGLDGDDSPFFESDTAYRRVDAEGNVTWARGRENPETKRARIATAKDICSACPVAARCLTDAMDFESLRKKVRAGIWGGLDEDERASLARDLAMIREAEAAAAAVRQAS